MIKAKITKIDGDTVYLLSEHGDDLEVGRLDIDFGILEGDSLFLRTESGDFKFRRLEKDEAQEGEPHYYDADWKKREEEYDLVMLKQAEIINKRTEEILKEAERLEVETLENEKNNLMVIVVVGVLLFLGILMFSISR